MIIVQMRLYLVLDLSSLFKLRMRGVQMRIHGPSVLFRSTALVDSFICVGNCFDKEKQRQKCPYDWHFV